MAGMFERVEIFHNTMEMCSTDDSLCQSVRSSLSSQRIYWEEDIVPPVPPRRFDHTELVLSRDRTCEAAHKYSGRRVGILNFASFVTPGGGVKHGATAQEESICRISTLYRCIADDSVKVYYDSHWDKINQSLLDRRNNDDIIFTPGVTVMKAPRGKPSSGLVLTLLSVA